MSVREHLDAWGMQNPGDLRIPRGRIIIPSRRVLLLGEEATLANREDFDEVNPLYENGDRPSDNDEADELKATTR